MSKLIKVRVKPGCMTFRDRRYREGEVLEIPETDGVPTWATVIGTEADAAAKETLTRRLEAQKGSGKRIALSEVAKKAGLDDPTHDAMR